ncbi:3601_t:CDS:2 [Racocetra fulgida]|uniref:3601_t:CDS:1 n=1 Tax=Racocetra fulgida TaxID=60492 RepID=A0A9N8YZ46_9GLOM|nr:3601_t:CDS:2 [Racocetra fulgida]
MDSLRDLGESTSNLDKEISVNNNNLEPEILTVLYRNHQISFKEIEVAVSSHNISLKQQEEDVNMLVVDLTSQDSDSEIKHQLNIYLDLNNSYILTKEKLKDSEIIKIILDKANKDKNSNLEDTNEEKSEISASKDLKSLN